MAHVDWPRMSCERLIPRHTRAPGFLLGIKQSINQSVTHSLSCRAYSRPCFGTRARIVPEIIASPLLLSSSVGQFPVCSRQMPLRLAPFVTAIYLSIFCIGANCKACHHVIDLQLLSVNTTIISRVSIAPPHGHSH